MWVKYLRNRIYVDNTPTKQHEKYPLLGALILFQNGLTLLLHFNQLPFILQGVTGNDEHTSNKYAKSMHKLHHTGAKLKQAKPTVKEKWRGIAFSFFMFFNIML